VESAKEAIRFADDLDNAALLQLVRAYAEDTGFRSTRIGDPKAAEEVRKAAQRVLDRRVTAK